MDSAAGEVGAKVAQLPVGSFVTPTSFGDLIARTASRILGRLVAQGELVRVRRVLYYKGAKTAAGMAGPYPYDVALHIAGPGSGLAGSSASSMLGLTTQVPSVLEIAVPRNGRLPVAPPGVVFTKRDLWRRRLDLNPLEVAVIEVASDWPQNVEDEWEKFEELVIRMIASGAVRPRLLVLWGAVQYGGELLELWRALEGIWSRVGTRWERDTRPRTPLRRGPLPWERA